MRTATHDGIDALCSWAGSVLESLASIEHDPKRTRSVATALRSAFTPSLNPKLFDLLGSINLDEQIPIRRHLAAVRGILRKLEAAAWDEKLSRALTRAALTALRRGE